MRLRRLIPFAPLLAAVWEFRDLTTPLQESAWRQASPGYEWSFPEDHASHPGYRIEWWYYTGNLADPEGRRFGYQLTFFRVGVDPAPQNPSRWTVRDLFMAHFAISDIGARRHRSAERLNRAGPGWAGAELDRYRVWNGSWQASLEADNRHRLSAAENGMMLELTLEEGKRPVLHGEGGYSLKGSQPGNASHYYSLTRMPTRGRVVLDGESHEVEGLSWMDHEFGTSFLEAEQIGWDWFSIQLDDMTELMLFQLRREDGTRDPRSSGTFIGADGCSRSIAPDNFTMMPAATWRSPHSKAEYPVAWSIAIPGLELALEVQAAIDDQELDAVDSSGVTYWEGAITIGGSRAGRPVRGRGYLEMTGYSGDSMGALFQLRR